jgi:SAM-dependent methyltransferase
VKSLARSILSYDPELETILRILKSVATPGVSTILEPGCGYGRILRPIQSLGFKPVGVEINAEIRSKNAKNGLTTIGIDELQLEKEKYDVVIMSHIIEHFKPGDLVEFMDVYLDCLKPNGHLIIATPLLSPYFYDNFDHIKPYHPNGILSVFGDDLQQIEFRSRNRLAIVDLWFRRNFSILIHDRSRYMRGNGFAWGRYRKAFLATIYWMTRGRFGTVDGWVGLFKKIGTR